MLTKAKEDHLSKKIFEEIDYASGIAAENCSMGNVLSKMGNNQQALEYLKKALEIDEDLNDRISMARDCDDLVLSRIGNNQALEYTR